MTTYNVSVQMGGISESASATTGNNLTTQNCTTADTIVLTGTVVNNSSFYHVSTTTTGLVGCTSASHTTSGVRNITGSGDPGNAGYQSGNSPSGKYTISPSSTGTYTAYIKEYRFYAFEVGEAGAWFRYYSSAYGRLTGTVSSAAQFVSGPISLGSIQSVFGGSNPIGLSEYIEGGSYVPDNDDNDSISNSTGESGGMSFSDYRNSTTTVPIYNSGTASFASDQQNWPGKSGGQENRGGFSLSGYGERTVWGTVGSITSNEIKIQGVHYGYLRGAYCGQEVGNNGGTYSYIIISKSSGTPADSTWNYLRVYNSSNSLVRTFTRTDNDNTNTGSAQTWGSNSRWWKFNTGDIRSTFTGANGGYITVE